MALQGLKFTTIIFWSKSIAWFLFNAQMALLYYQSKIRKLNNKIPLKDSTTFIRILKPPPVTQPHVLITQPLVIAPNKKIEFVRYQ